MKKKKSDWLIIILFLMPAVILFSMFIYYPIFNTVYLSFREWRGIYGSPKIFVGLSNYVHILRSKAFWGSLLNSFYFMVGGFLVLMPLAFALALLITSRMKGTRMMKTAYFMPVMLSTTAVALMWSYILNPSFGALNQFLRAVHLGSLTRSWLSTPVLNIWSIVLVNEWMYAGYNMLIFAAGLTAIPKDLYDSAEIDGCGHLGKLCHISIPLSRESFKVFSVLCVTGCVRVFDIVWAMTRGGPNHTSDVPATLLYTEAFTFKFFGSSSAIGVLMLILGMSLSLLINRLLRSEEA